MCGGDGVRSLKVEQLFKVRVTREKCPFRDVSPQRCGLFKLVQLVVAECSRIMVACSFLNGLVVGAAIAWM